MKTFVKVVESWVPSGDRSMLEYGGALYGEHALFGADAAALGSRVQSILQRLPSASGATVAQPQLSRATGAIVTGATASSTTRSAA